MTEHLFLRACRRQPVERTPIWMMRQAGRYLPSYRATRERAGSFLALCRSPELACEVTLQPIDQLGFDAAILFSDILITLPPMGLEVAFPESGPKIATPIRTRAAIEPARDVQHLVLEVDPAAHRERRELAHREQLGLRRVARRDVVHGGKPLPRCEHGRIDVGSLRAGDNPVAVVGRDLAGFGGRAGRCGEEQEDPFGHASRTTCRADR